jgi:hypothetical protein
MITIQLQSAAVKVMEMKIRAKPGNIALRLMIAGQHIHLVSMPGQERADTFQAASPIHQIPGSKVVIRLSFHEPFENSMIGMDIGKDQQLHLTTIKPEASRFNRL